MMFRTHEVAGIVAATAALPLLANKGIISNSELSIICFYSAGAMIGAMLPDIDSPTSKIRRGIRKLFTGNPNTDKRIINHRRLPHMPLFWIAVFAILWFWVSNIFAQAFIVGTAIGVFSHLAVDILNPAGIPLMGPIYKKKISLLPIKTNSWAENVFAIMLILLEVYLIFFSDLTIINLSNFKI